MAERKKLGKKKRFEVFKRDKFTCQYCGRKAPDVILEIDHIKPVAEGGNNGILNLITSCRDCNRGKGKTLLSVNEEIVKQQDRLHELAEKREQMEMLMEWKEELADFENTQVDYVQKYLTTLSGFSLSETGRANVKNQIRRFSLSEVVESLEIAISQYYHPGDQKSIEYAMKKLGGICYNRRKQREEHEED